MPRKVFEHRIFDVEVFEVDTPAGVAEFVRICSCDWVNIVPITEQGEVVLVRQHRYGIDAPTLEVPGGLIDGEESPATAAVRELREETGFGDGAVRSLGWVYPNPAIQDNRTFLYAALGVRLVGEPDPDPDEEIYLERVPLHAIPQLILDGKITHALALNALSAVLARRDHPDFAPYFAKSASGEADASG